jgi:hypothetical protein
VRAILDRYEALAIEVLLGDGRGPLPIMPWTKLVTAGGRLLATTPPA